MKLAPFLTVFENPTPRAGDMGVAFFVEVQSVERQNVKF
jgi:hypothetical protein